MKGLDRFDPLYPASLYFDMPKKALLPVLGDNGDFYYSTVKKFFLSTFSLFSLTPPVVLANGVILSTRGYNCDFKLLIKPLSPTETTDYGRH